MPNIQVTVDQSLWAVRLEATDAVGTCNWYRRRLGQDAWVGSTQGPGVLWDYQPELNLTYDYIAVDDIDSATATGIVVAGDMPVLSSTVSAVAREVTVVRVRPLRGTGRTAVHDILGRADPVVTIHPARYPEFQLQLLCADDTERRQLADMLQLGEPLIIRSDCPDRVPTFVFIMREWEDPFLNDAHREGPSYMNIAASAVTDTGVERPDPDRTYQDILDDTANPTYGDVLAAHTDYRQLLDGPP